VSPAKRFLLISLSVYAAIAAIGILWLRSPNLSARYLAQNDDAHKKLVDITNDPGFQMFRERPHLYPPEDARHEQLAFVRAYQAQPEYRTERLRIEAFTLYFHVLNGVTFLVLAVRFAYRPAIDYLDRKVRDTRAHMAQASKARTAAMHRLAEVHAEADKWHEKEAELKTHADEAINTSLVQIREEARLARIQLARETEDRKYAELYRAAAAIKQDLVNRAIDTLQARYAAEVSELELRDKIDQFVRLLDLIA
jgi:F0F1-type ATP synthase membrane subunit b/b'